MRIFSGTRLTYLAVLLVAASLAGAAAVAATGDLRLPPAVDARQRDAAPPDPARLEAEIALAGEAERRGDVAAALAELAASESYVRPALSEQPAFSIEAGRHPVVEAALLA